MSLISEAPLDEIIGETITVLRTNDPEEELSKTLVAVCVAETIASRADRDVSDSEFNQLVKDVKKQLPYYAPELR